MLIEATFRDVYNMGLEGPIFGPFETPKVSQNYGLWSLSQNVFTGSQQYCFTYSLQVLSFMCGIWASEVQFWGHFGCQDESRFRCLVIFSNSFFYWFHVSDAHMLIASTIRCVENMGLRGPIFGPLWAPKLVKIPLFGNFLKTFHWFHISIALHINFRYFYRYVEYWPLRLNFRVIWAPK